MTEIEIEGEYQGVKGKFKWRGSFPLVLESCQHMIDKNKIKGKLVYLGFHGGEDGKPHISWSGDLPQLGDSPQPQLGNSGGD